MIMSIRQSRGFRFSCKDRTFKVNNLFIDMAFFFFCFVIAARGHYILLIELNRSVWENLDLGRVYRPHCVKSVFTTSVKILPYRPTCTV